jgi:hypothetical protein
MKRFFNKPIGLFLLALLVVVSGLGAALHSYTGPQNRTRTEPVEVCKVVLLYPFRVRIALFSRAGMRNSHPRAL